VLTAFAFTIAIAKKPVMTVEVPIEITPKKNLKTECSQLVADQLDLDKALEVCNQAVDEAPDDGDTYYYRAYVHFYRDEMDAAETDATRAIELKTSRLAKAYYLRGTIKERNRELREASADFKKALELEPDWSAARRKVDDYAWAYESE
jgi:tetratricopeptide (TPR) repeat protein